MEVHPIRIVNTFNSAESLGTYLGSAESERTIMGIVRRRKRERMKVHIGCGARVMDGWVNCDIVRNPNAPRDPELLCDARDIPLDDGVADIVMAIHNFEHYYRWECDEVIKEWRRLLKPGGLLILELPDLIKCCQNIIDGYQKAGKHPDQLGRWGLYGDPRLKDKYMCHPWGWAPDELIAFLHGNGFTGGVHKPTQYHRAGRDHRDMRIEARKA